MLERIVYGLLGAALLICFLMFRTYGFIALILVLGSISIYEINKAFKAGNIKSNPIPGYIFIALLIPSYYIIGGIGIFVLLGGCMYLNFSYYVLRQKIDEEMLYSNIQFIYPCFMIAFACPILLGDYGFSGFAYLVCIIVCCFATDICAYFTGVFFGRNKLCPDISPKKTIEGSIGGFCGSVIISVVLYFVIPFILNTVMPLYMLIALGIGCGIFAQIGDLTASIIKRICGIKDFGNLIPGHGGILDRLDSIIFCLPVAYCIILLFVF